MLLISSAWNNIAKYNKRYSVYDAAKFIKGVYHLHLKGFNFRIMRWFAKVRIGFVTTWMSVSQIILTLVMKQLHRERRAYFEKTVFEIIKFFIVIAIIVILTSALSQFP